MQKNAPSIARILAMVFFALSCIGILLYLWLTFGGALPLQPKQYQLSIRFPEATTLADEADVRISGVKVGRVTDLVRDGNTTKATLQIEKRFAPIHADSHAVLRQKTLLGETYVELTPGTRGARTLRDGSTLPSGQIAETVQLDEIFRTFDKPTRDAFRTWMDQQGRAVRGRGADLNDALGNLTPFVHDAGKVVAILHQQSADTRRLVRDTGVVFQALTARDGQLTQLISNSNRVFETTAARNRELQEIFTIFPTFLNEARATTVRTTTFSRNANPLITQLRPAARQLSPTLIQLHGLAPDLKGLFRDLGPLITVSRKGLPALEGVLRDAKPLLAQLDPFLRNVNPILDWIGLYKHETASFFALDASATQAVDFPPGAAKPIHYLRTSNPFNPENLAVWPHRVASNRSNPYVEPLGYKNFPLKVFGTYLCTTNQVPPLANPSDIPPIIKNQLPADVLDLVQQFALSSGNTAPPCVEQKPLGRFKGQTGKYPHIVRAPAK
ncbi:MAG: phospholipid/cholesterol/gamma-HCH transport system substrate-binding protein [Thermoleophilaceae bacterium]|jgi:virulence factor Mce-like protein|nr:phospholipid/cholesterol/gamma-HCH transport system substrate-binding protein [Thermoleophilaceae bacterium]MEA2367805.1 phospholipid/cholesterol/gamma-HCH transport system substrate-binding protein [Thermoleophilaceae bacterium]